ncbi:TetR/AcrR family transcriptional regulator [Achromobacter xylosoxidans]|uniref:TetR/AcrR family transcriptional regulator n=1 Tax=Alcaligenes xylosoxydans xylosoxydans TaxID=85698 RepID=UPI0006C26B20|nr:TetR/AcrR family transcriptional regulator [Achromobacter xylosoxidans]MDH0524710.1 TetR/AcrR family transcriptional regulator [Achromobacter xylosoxidans]MDH0545075.1 TetR/AcrR family transcriptional regulator [Achromobacter xylosoxidans]CUI61198.1 HTH-type transcriptional regulator yjdC [Achromobacter xylosoxidans]
MPSDTALPSPDTRQRLLQATERLIYAGGIHATGMDLIVRTSGVARKQVYRLYPNKDALVAAALRARDERWMQWFVATSSRAQAPRARLLAMFDALREWFGTDDFRGCAFLNAAGEIGDEASPILAVAREHKARLLEYVRTLTRAAALPDPDEAAAQLLVLIDGAIAVALVTRDPAIADSAGRAAAALLGQSG